jgi:hypothetical protein
MCLLYEWFVVDNDFIMVAYTTHQIPPSNTTVIFSLTPQAIQTLWMYDVVCHQTVEMSRRAFTFEWFQRHFGRLLGVVM